MKKIKLGVVGPGLIWEREHKPAINKLKDLFEVNAFCATSERSKNKVMKEFPVATFFLDYKEMVKKPEIDAVVVLTPIRLNATVAIAALEANKDVILEKPMAANSLEAKELMKAEKIAKKKVIILEQNVFMKQKDEFKNIIENKILGDIIFYELLIHQFLCEEGNELSYGNIEWRKNPDFQLGTLYDSGIHEIALLSSIFGRPEYVYATATDNYRKDYGGIESLAALFEYAGYLKGFYSHSSFLLNKRNYFNIRGTEGLAYIEGHKIIIEKNNGYKEEKEVFDGIIHDKMWAKIYEMITDKIRIDYTTANSYDDIITLESIGESLKKSDRIKISY